MIAGPGERLLRITEVRRTGRRCHARTVVRRVTLRLIVVTGSQREARHFVISQQELGPSLSHWTRRNFGTYSHRGAEVPKPPAPAAAARTGNDKRK
jgi:hypothetical protein